MSNEIIEMARQAGLCLDINNGIYLCAPKHLEAFAKLVAAKERERLAKIAEKNGNEILAMQLRGEA